MGSRWRSVCAAASATEAELLWRSQSPLTSMAGTLRSTHGSGSFRGALGFLGVLVSRKF